MAAPLTIGSDFAGLDSVAWALKILNVDYASLFCCDSDPSSQKVISCAGTRTLHVDITKRDHMNTAAVNLYSFGPPCQPFSTKGSQLGTTDARGVLALHSLTYILLKRPDMLFMEQVPNIVKIAPQLMDLILTELTKAGYSVHSQILRTDHFGVPQRRERLYVVAFLREVRPFAFPPPIACQPVSSFITPLPPDAFEVLPSCGGVKRSNVECHMQRRIQEGVNPFERAVFVASGSSPTFCNSSVDTCMTITRSEAQRSGYWCSIKGGFLETVDIARLQGYRDGLIPWQQLGISDAQAGGLLGNAMSLNVLLHLLPGVLYAGGFTSEAEFQRHMRLAREFHPARSW